MLGLPPEAAIDVLNDDNAPTYWDRSDRFDMALDLTAGRRGLAALGDVLARWIDHLLATAVDIAPLVAVRDVTLTWYVGLDAEGTKIGDRLWSGEELEQMVHNRIIGLYRLHFRDPPDVLDTARGEPIYLIMAMTPDGTLRVKPQNLLTGLPVRQSEEVS
jgi:hypothetical protein